MTISEVTPTEVEVTFTTDYEEAKRLSDEEVAAQFLAWINIQRGEHDLPLLEELPKGRPYAPGKCVGANALSPIGDESCSWAAARYDGRSEEELAEQTAGAHYSYAYQGRKITVEIPHGPGQFPTRFDEGCYPHLVEGPLAVVGPIIVGPMIIVPE